MKLLKNQNTKFKINKKVYLASALTAAIFSLTTSANASVVQILPGMGYTNPAMLFLTEQGQFILGADFANPNFTYTGITGASGGVVGQANSNGNDFLPNGMFAYRINPKLVLGLVVSSPILADINWGPNSFVRFTTTRTYNRTVDVSPKVSVQITPDLSFGMGLDLEETYTHFANFTPAPQLGNLVNHSTAMEEGFDLGLAYKFQANIFDLTYYSARPQYLSGLSTTQSGLFNQSYNSVVYDPEVVYFNWIHFFSKKFLGWATVYYSGWNQRSIDFNNTAIGSPTAPTFYNPTWSYLLGGQYNFYKSWSFILAGMYETQAGPDRYNLVGFPLGSFLSGTVGFSYQVNKKFSARLLYTRGGYVPKAIINGNLGDFGNVAFGLNVVGLQLAYKW